jgi:hypothetical protein
MGDWDVIESAVEYENSWYTGGYDLVEQPDGTTKRYYWAALPPAVVIVAVDGDELVFVEQYRPTIGEPQLELPAGIVDEHDGAPVETVDPDDYETAGHLAKLARTSRLVLASFARRPASIQAPSSSSRSVRSRPDCSDTAGAS